MKKKRWIYFATAVASAALSVGLIACDDETSDGSGDSSQANNEAQYAETIAVNEAFTDNCQMRNEPNWYKFEVPQDGRLLIEIEHENIPTKERVWSVALYTSDGVTEYADCQKEWYVRGNENFSSPSLGVAAGTYYLLLTGGNTTYVDWEFSDLPYTVNLNFTESENWETENNGSVETATPIPVNATTHGTLVNSSDTDWYCFTLEQNGYFTFDFTHENVPSTDTFWKLQLYGADGITDYTNVEKTWSVKGNENVSSAKMGAAAGMYYLQIKAYNHSDKEYHLNINYTATNNWEKENNGGYDKANTLTLNETVYGTIICDDSAWSYAEDQDWYSLSVSPAMGLKLTFTHTMLPKTGIYWKITVYGSDGITKVATADIKGNEESTQLVWSGTGTFYIKITYGNNVDYHSEDQYGLLVERLDS